MGFNIFGINVPEPFPNNKDAILNAAPDSFKSFLNTILENGLTPEIVMDIFSDRLLEILKPMTTLIHAYQERFLRQEQYCDLLNQQEIKKLSDSESQKQLKEKQILDQNDKRSKLRLDAPIFFFGILLSEKNIESLKTRISSETKKLFNDIQKSRKLIQKLYEKDLEIEHNDDVYDTLIKENKMTDPTLVQETPPAIVLSESPLRLHPSERQLAVGDRPVVPPRLQNLQKNPSQYRLDIGDFGPDELRRFAIENSARKQGFTL